MTRSKETSNYPAGTYLCFGAAVKPFVVILAAREAAEYADLQRMKVSRSEAGAQEVRAQVFGRGVEAALPAWSKDCMEMIALQYEGVYQVEVRGLAAALALGLPIGNGKDLSEGPDGGLPVAAPQPGPKRPGPRGEAKKLPALYDSILQSVEHLQS